MNPALEKIVVLEADPASREQLVAALRTAGYEVSGFAAPGEVLDAVRQSPPDILLLDGGILEQGTHSILATIRGSAATAGVRVILLATNRPEDRAAALDLGADDAISRPWHEDELLARIRAQLRVRRIEKDFQEKLRIAEEGQHIAHTAFEALAVTEKMTSDAFSLDRSLKVGFAAVFAVAAVMAGLYFVFAHSARTQTKQANRIIAGLEGGIIKQQNLIAEVRQLRAQQSSDYAVTPGKDELQKHAADLKSKMENASSGELADLQKELADTNARLKRVEEQSGSAQNLIPTDVQSVCLLHVSVAFRNVQSGQRLRYAGLNPQGEPIEDSTGNAIVTLEGRGPEVKMDVSAPAS